MSITAQARLTHIIAALDGALAEARGLIQETHELAYITPVLIILHDDLIRCHWLAMSVKSADKADGKHPER